MTKILIAAAVVIILGGGGWYLTSQKVDSGDAMMAEEGAMMEEEVMMEGGDAMMEEGAMMMEAHGTYEEYAPEKVALAAEGDVLLFFHADWCPACRAIESEIEKDSSVLPEGLHILKVDYDTATALRQQYKVTTQHTFVQVTATGELIQRFNNESKLAGVLARVK